MRILIISTVFNSLTQRIFCEMKESGHTVSVQFAISDELMQDGVESFLPDIIICPYLTKFIPDIIYTKFPTFIIHPGILGDKGPHSLDHAILDEKEEWGVSIIRANGEFDGGDVWASQNFPMRDTKKSSIYRHEVSSAASKAVFKLLEHLQESSFEPLTQLPTPMHKIVTQRDRAIDWKKNTAKEIVKKINASDGFPGVLDELLGVKCYLFGAHFEAFEADEELKSASQNAKPKEIFAKRDGAVCIKTVDGAVWVSHLKEVSRFKLPATYVLKERLKGIKEFRIPLIMETHRETFYEISVQMKEEAAYLYFDFYNGAFSSEQSIRLKYAVEYLQERCKVLVLMGGEDFFSNGIHLNILEDSKKAGEDGWSNINAMNDMVRSVLLCEDILTVAALRGGAGAGGVFLGTACDYVVAREGVVLNAHYKTIGLTGSEFHTYTLPRRVGEAKADGLLQDALPLTAKEAQKIGLVDKIFGEERKSFYEELDAFVQSLIQDEDVWYELLDAKREKLQRDGALIAGRHKEELDTMYPQFWDEKSVFHSLRRDFVYKKCPLETPKRLIYKGEKDA
ncbi:hydrogenase maturation protein [Sulfurimonas sp. HSL-1716]|uniref:hydrogenase maturation protein n=1 Tax=Hydrocurvibacter sulfurireducens TaxID=3131937 RepID=UPI0031F7F2CB